MKDRTRSKKSSSKTPKKIGRKFVSSELQLLRLLRAPLDRGVKPKMLLLENGHDAAVVSGFKRSSLSLTVDRVVEDVHFRARWSDARSIAAKVFASNVSDLLAVGSEPAFGLLSLTFSRAPLEQKFVRRLGDAFAAEARRYQMRIVGGNVTRAAGPFTADLTALGTQDGKPFRRDALRPGMVILAVQPHGNAAAGLALLEHFGNVRRVPPAFRRLVRAQLYPQVRPGVVHALRAARRPVAAMDTSDGLRATVETLAQQSSCKVLLNADALAPTSLLRRAAELLQCNAHRWLCDGGEDYGLVVGLAVSDAARVTAALSAQRIPWKVIGRAVRGRGVDGWTRDLGPPGWDPFR